MRLKNKVSFIWCYLVNASYYNSSHKTTYNILSITTQTENSLQNHMAITNVQ